MAGMRKLGARIDDPKKPALPFAAFRAVTPVPHPASVDYTDPGWAMLGNDKAGDCEAVRIVNNRRHLLKYLKGVESYMTQDQTWTIYKTQNPTFEPGDGPNGYESKADGGMDTQTLAEYYHANPLPDGGQIAFFAKVDHTKPDEVAAAIAIFGDVWVDISVSEANQDQFDQGVDWDYDPSSPIEGLHAVLAVGYINDNGRIRLITWAEETGFTASYWLHQVQQVFVIAYPEHFGTTSFQVGVDREKLAAAYQALTGKTLVLPPLPGPDPIPDPPVTPPVTPPPPAGGGASFPGSSVAVDQVIAHRAKRLGLSVQAWMEHHFEEYLDLDPQ